MIQGPSVLRYIRGLGEIGESHMENIECGPWHKK